MSKKSNRFSPEVRERAVSMVLKHHSKHPSLWNTIESIAPKIGCVPQTLKDLEREVKNFAKPTKSLSRRALFFAQAELDRRLKS